MAVTYCNAYSNGRFHSSPGILNTHQLLVGKDQVFGRETLIIVADYPEAVTSGMSFHGSPVDTKLLALEFSQILPVSAAGHFG